MQLAAGIRIAARSAVLLALAVITAGVASAQQAVPRAPEDVELEAGDDASITVSWAASSAATSYNIYRGTSSGSEGDSPIASTTGTEYTDRHLSPEPVYFYQVTAVNVAGESARSEEDASRTPPPVGSGGNVAGIPSANASTVYYAVDALLDGFDWFQIQNGWFPQVLYSSGSQSPGQLVVDMAYSTRGSMTFNNVVVPTRGLYTLSWRYAFDWGFYPGVTNRQMGLRVNGQTITSAERFIITGSFDDFQQSSLQVDLNAGVNTVALFAVSKHGVSRVDQLTVTPATASVPSEPTSLMATAATCSSGISLSWTPSARGGPTSYNVYRGFIADGEDIAPIASTTDAVTSFIDADVHTGATYFYAVAANNSVGISPDSNEIAVTPGC
jgi:fibronectin type III domain protein